MKSQNEYYYKQKLKEKIDKFFDDELCGDHDLGYLGYNTQDLMVEAAWLILMANKDLNDYMESQNMLAQ